MDKEEAFTFMSEQKTAFLGSINESGFPMIRARTRNHRHNRDLQRDAPTKEMIWQEGNTKYYKKDINDPDYCVLKFTCIEAEYYCDFKKERIIF